MMRLRFLVTMMAFPLLAGVPALAEDSSTGQQPSSARAVPGAAQTSPSSTSTEAPEALQRGTHFNMTPQEAVAAMTMPDGFHVVLSASEPLVRQPNAFCVDDRGRLWVGENYTYTKTGWEPDDRDRILIFT